MSFETVLRKKIADFPIGNPSKNLLKVVLGEVQQKSAIKAIKDEQCYSIVRSMMKSNKETMVQLTKLNPDDERIKNLEEENCVLESLLPKYWSEDDIKGWISDEKIDVNYFPNVGACVGYCMKKLTGHAVEGATVKKVVEQLRG